MRKKVVGLPSRLGIALTLIFGIAINACSGGSTPMFRYSLAGKSEVRDEIVIVKADTYSVAIEAVVNTSTQNARKQAWTYLEIADASAPLQVRVVIATAEGEPVFQDEVTNPELSSWNSKRLYLEIAKVKLDPGIYRIHFTHSGKVLSHPSFSGNLVVTPAYQGK